MLPSEDYERQLRDSHARHDAILDVSVDCIVSFDFDGRILEFNRAAETCFGCSRADVIGESVIEKLVDPGAKEVCLRGLRRLTRFMNPAAGRRRSKIFARRADGRSFPAEFVLEVIATHPPAVIVSLQDVSDREKTHREIARLQDRAAMLETTKAIALQILASETGVEALRMIASTARTLTGARMAAVGVARADKGVTEFVAADAHDDPWIEEQLRESGAAPLLHPKSAGGDAPAALSVSVMRSESVVGHIFLNGKQDGGGFTEEDESAVGALSPYAAVAIHNMQILSRQHALATHLMTAQEEERHAMAFDLHDGLTQHIMAAHAHLETFGSVFAAGGADRDDPDFKLAQRYLSGAVAESRRLVSGLRSLALDDLGLAGALDLLVQEEKTRASWSDVQFVHNVDDGRFDKALETSIYRIAQESLTNARKHASTQCVRLSLLILPNLDTGQMHLTLDIQDWGRGFDRSLQSARYDHLGLQGMAERAALLGGSFRVLSEPGLGTTVSAAFPFLGADAPRAASGAAGDIDD